MLMLNRELLECVDLIHNVTLSSRLQNKTPRQQMWSVLAADHTQYLQDISQVSRADLRVFSGVERNRGNLDEGKHAGFGVPPQHHPWAIIRLAVKHHLMWSWQFLGSCKIEDLEVRCKYLDVKLSGIKMQDFSCASQEDIN